MSTPNTVLKISQRNPIARELVRAWRDGVFTWEDMLFELANLLERRCNDLVDENNLRSQILSDKFLNCPFPVLEFSLIPDLSNIRHPLERQSALTNAIVEIENIYQHLLKCVERKISISPPPIIFKLPENASESDLREVMRYKAHLHGLYDPTFGYE